MSKKKPTAEQIAAVKRKVEPGYLAIKIPYKTLLVTHDKGAAIIGLLAEAELVTGLDYGDTEIENISQDSSVETKLVSRQQYLDIKMAALLGVTYKEFMQKEEIPF